MRTAIAEVMVTPVLPAGEQRDCSESTMQPVNIHTAMLARSCCSHIHAAPAASSKGSYRNFFSYLALAESRPSAWDRHGCLRHCMTTQIRSVDSVACAESIPQKTRRLTREALEQKRYLRPTPLVNLRRSSRRPDKVDETSSALHLPTATHRRMTSDDHPLEVERAVRPLLTCPCSPQRAIRAFGRCAGKGWLLELGG